MKALATFEFEGSGVTVLQDQDGNPWWVAKEVCAVLGTSTRDLPKILDVDEYTNVDSIHFSHKGGKPWTIINEPGLYSLILRSRKPEAKAFKRWVTHDVLPVIRKTGQYKTYARGNAKELLASRLSRGKFSTHEQIQFLKLADRMSEMDEERLESMLDIYDILCSGSESYVDSPSGIDIPEAINEFIADRCILEPTSYVGATTLFEAFEEWCLQHAKNIRVFQKKFGMIMRMRFEAAKIGGLYRYYGLRLRQSTQPGLA